MSDLYNKPDISSKLDDKSTEGSIEGIADTCKVPRVDYKPKGFLSYLRKPLLRWTLTALTAFYTIVNVIPTTGCRIGGHNGGTALPAIPTYNYTFVLHITGKNGNIIGQYVVQGTDKDRAMYEHVFGKLATGTTDIEDPSKLVQTLKDGSPESKRFKKENGIAEPHIDGDPDNGEITGGVRIINEN